MAGAGQPTRAVRTAVHRRGPLVSVVTPVYNGEETLSQCIESVLAQTYDNFEYLIVNNCSGDRTREIAQAYADRDSRVRVYDNENLVTAMENHQVGFRLMSPTSGYCKVVHADDWIFPECLDRMVALAEANPSVAMVSAYRLEETYVTLDGLPFPSSVLPGREVCRLALLGEVYVFGTPTSLMIRSDVVRSRDPFYDEREYPRHCDTAVCYEILRNRDFGFVHQVLTFTRRSGAVRTALSQRLGSSLPEHLAILKRYGPAYLGSHEYEARLRQMVRAYYRFLGTSVFRRPGGEFWSYHREFLRRLELSNSRARIGCASLGAVLGALSRPAKSFARALHPEPETE